MRQFRQKQISPWFMTKRQHKAMLFYQLGMYWRRRGEGQGCVYAVIYDYDHEGD